MAELDHHGYLLLVLCQNVQTGEDVVRLVRQLKRVIGQSEGCERDSLGQLGWTTSSDDILADRATWRVSSKPT